MYITKEQKQILLQAEEIIEKATKQAKEKLKFSSYLINVFYDNCLDKKDTDDVRLIELCEKVNNSIKDFVYYCSDNGYQSVFEISDFNKVENLPGEVIKKMASLLANITQLKIYKSTGVNINELQ